MILTTYYITQPKFNSLMLITLSIMKEKYNNIIMKDILMGYRLDQIGIN